MILPWNQYKYNRFESREFSTIDSNYPLSCPLSFKGIAKHLSTHCCAGNFCSSWDKMNRVLRNWQAPNVTSTIGMVQWRNIGSGCALLTPILCPSGLFGAPSWALAIKIFFDDLFFVFFVLLLMPLVCFATPKILFPPPTALFAYPQPPTCFAIGIPFHVSNLHDLKDWVVKLERQYGSCCCFPTFCKTLVKSEKILNKTQFY